MTRDEFDRGLLAWGEALDAWPDAPRRAAQRLLARDEKARALLLEMAAFDAALGAAVAVEVDAGAVAARAQAGLQARLSLWRLRDLVPLGPLIGLGSLAGACGAVAALIVPAALQTGPLLVYALSGVTP